MKQEWKSTVRAGIITGLILAGLISPMSLMKNLPCSPVILIGFAALFPVAGFIVGRKAIEHPIWASVISALLASLMILILGIVTAESSSEGTSSSSLPARLGMLFAMAQLMSQMWLQQTVVLTALSSAGGSVALFINRKKGSSNKPRIRSDCEAVGD